MLEVTSDSENSKKFQLFFFFSSHVSKNNTFEEFGNTIAHRFLLFLRKNFLSVFPSFVWDRKDCSRVNPNSLFLRVSQQNWEPRNSIPGWMKIWTMLPNGNWHGPQAFLMHLVIMTSLCKGCKWFNLNFNCFTHEWYLLVHGQDPARDPLIKKILPLTRCHE